MVRRNMWPDDATGVAMIHTLISGAQDCSGMSVGAEGAREPKIRATGEVMGTMIIGWL